MGTFVELNRREGRGLWGLDAGVIAGIDELKWIKIWVMALGACGQRGFYRNRHARSHGMTEKRAIGPSWGMLLRRRGSETAAMGRLVHGAKRNPNAEVARWAPSAPWAGWRCGPSCPPCIADNRQRSLPGAQELSRFASGRGTCRRRDPGEERGSERDSGHENGW